MVITLFSLEKILREKKELVLLAGFELTSSGSKSNSYVHFSINIELKKNVGLVTDCHIALSYFSCFGLLADTSLLKVNDGVQKSKCPRRF